jgi:hypothetical protein
LEFSVQGLRFRPADSSEALLLIFHLLFPIVASLPHIYTTIMVAHRRFPVSFRVAAAGLLEAEAETCSVVLFGWELSCNEPSLEVRGEREGGRKVGREGERESEREHAHVRARACERESERERE